MNRLLEGPLGEAEPNRLTVEQKLVGRLVHQGKCKLNIRVLTWVICATAHKAPPFLTLHPLPAHLPLQCRKVKRHRKAEAGE